MATADRLQPRRNVLGGFAPFYYDLHDRMKLLEQIAYHGSVEHLKAQINLKRDEPLTAYIPGTIHYYRNVPYVVIWAYLSLEDNYAFNEQRKQLNRGFYAPPDSRNAIKRLQSSRTESL